MKKALRKYFYRVRGTLEVVAPNAEEAEEAMAEWVETAEANGEAVLVAEHYDDEPYVEDDKPKGRDD